MSRKTSLDADRGQVGELQGAGDLGRHHGDAEDDQQQEDGQQGDRGGVPVSGDAPVDQGEQPLGGRLGPAAPGEGETGRSARTGSTPRSLKVILDQFGQGGEGQWEVVLAASVIATVPMVIIFFLGQHSFVGGDRHHRPQGLTDRADWTTHDVVALGEV